MGFIRYGGREPDAREEEGAAVDEGDMGLVVEAEEKTAGRDEEDGVGTCPFPVTECLSKSEPAEEKMLCRSARACPDGWRKDDPPLPVIRRG